MQPRAHLGRTIADSIPAFTPLPKPPDGAPNVVVIVLDDTGFAQLGCFGSDIATPNIDRLAAGGLRYNRFHVTALCSPTRACLLTGRNHHKVGMGFLTDVPIGFPGYNGRIPRSAAALPRLLRDNGYSTYAVGKWHLAPRWEQSAAGPFDLWPLGLGFERYYGFLAGDANHWAPELVADNGFIETPGTVEDGYHLTEDLVDQACKLILDQQHAAPTKPFFLYFATGAMHAPHHVAPEWIEAYRGRFDEGWSAWREQVFARQVAAGIVPDGTVLTERPAWVPDWDTLSADERHLFARMMEVFAGFLTHTDAQIGRLLDFLERLEVLDDTIVLLISDNGTSAEGGPRGSLNEHRFTHDMLDDLDDTLAHIDDLGGPRSYPHYPWGWAWAGNTPFRLWKRYSWLGGVRTPLIVHWPNGIEARGEVRSQFAHAIDLLPTLLDVLGLDVPETVDGVAQQALDGSSLRSTFADAAAEDPRTTQYFEIIGSRAIIHDNWKATTDHVGQQLSVERELIEGSHDFDTDHWALFDLSTDFSESTDVGEANPDRLRSLIELWWSEAGRNDVLPLDDSFIGRASALEPSPFPPRFLTSFFPGGGQVAEDLLPPMGAGFRLHATLRVPEGTASGILCALGDWNNGWALYLLHGCPVLTFNLFGAPQRFVGAEPVPAGVHVVTVHYEPHGDPAGRVRISVDGDVSAEGILEGHLPFRWQIGGTGLLLCHDRGLPVCDDYKVPFAFEGELHKVTMEIPWLAPPDAAALVARALRHE